MKLDQLITEMPRNYSYPPDSTKEQKKEIKGKVSKNISASITRVRAFESKVEALMKEWEAICEEELKGVKDEASARFGPLSQLRKVNSALGDILAIADKAIAKLADSSK